MTTYPSKEKNLQNSSSKVRTLFLTGVLFLSLFVNAFTHSPSNLAENSTETRAVNGFSGTHSSNPIPIVGTINASFETTQVPYLWFAANMNTESIYVNISGNSSTNDYWELGALNIYTAYDRCLTAQFYVQYGISSQCTNPSLDSSILFSIDFRDSNGESHLDEDLTLMITISDIDDLVSDESETYPYSDGNINQDSTNSIKPLIELGSGVSGANIQGFFEDQYDYDYLRFETPFKGTHLLNLTFDRDITIQPYSYNGALSNCERTDNTGFSNVKDIYSGYSGSSPSSLTAVGNTLYFEANNGNNGYELWKTDGTEAGTSMVKDINNGYSSSSPSYLTAVGNTLYFEANNGNNGYELWKTDGTESGTSMVKDINNGGNGGNPYSLTAVGNTLYFVAIDGNNGYELWKSDGTASGTVMVKDINSGTGGSSPSSLTAVGNTLYFVAIDGNNGYELWKSDGTASGTVMVKDIRSGSGSSSPSSLTAVGNTLYFQANDGINGYELWKTDGTEAGTSMVKDINNGYSSSSPSYLTAVGNTLYFKATDGINGNELWKTDGTESGTMVKDINNGGSGGNPYSLTAVGNTLYFVADNGNKGNELWKTDGTEAGTSMVKDIYSGYSSSSPSSLTAVGNTLYFKATDGNNGYELWKTDGTEAGTSLVRDIYSGSSSSGVTEITSFNGKLYFNADNGYVGNELFSLIETAVTTYKRFYECLVIPSSDTFDIQFDLTADVDNSLYPYSWNADINFEQIHVLEDPNSGDSDGESYTPTLLPSTSSKTGVYNSVGDKDKYAIQVDHGTLQEIEIKTSTSAQVLINSLNCFTQTQTSVSQITLSSGEEWNVFVCDTKYNADEIVFSIAEINDGTRTSLYPGYEMRLSTVSNSNVSLDTPLEMGMEDIPKRGMLPNLNVLEKVNGTFHYWSDQTDTYALTLEPGESIQLNLSSNCASFYSNGWTKPSYAESKIITYGGLLEGYGTFVSQNGLQEMHHVPVYRSSSNSVYDVELKDICTYKIQSNPITTVGVLSNAQISYDGRMGDSSDLVINNFTDYLPLHTTANGYTITVPLDILPTKEGYLEATQASNEPVSLLLRGTDFPNSELNKITVGQHIDFGSPRVQWNELRVSGLDGSELTVKFVEKPITLHTKESSELYSIATGSLGPSHDEGWDGSDTFEFNNTDSSSTFASVRITSLSDTLKASFSGGKMTSFVCFNEFYTPSVSVYHDSGNGAYTMQVNRGMGTCPSISVTSPSMVPSASNFQISYTTNSLDLKLNLRIFNENFESVYTSSNTNSTQLVTLPELEEGRYLMLLMDDQGITYHEKSLFITNQPNRLVQTTSSYLDVNEALKIRVYPFMPHTGEPLAWEFTNITLETLSLSGEKIEQLLEDDFSGLGAEVITLDEIPEVMPGSMIKITGELYINNVYSIHTLVWKVAYIAPDIECESAITPDIRSAENDLLCLISMDLETHGYSLADRTSNQKFEGTLDVYSEDFSLINQIEFASSLFDETIVRINTVEMKNGTYFVKTNFSTANNMYFQEEVGEFVVNPKLLFELDEAEIGSFDLTIISVRDTAAAGDDIVLAWNTEGEKAAYFVAEIYSNDVLVDSFSIINDGETNGKFEFELPDNSNPYLDHEIRIYAYSEYGLTSIGTSNIEGVNKQSYLDVNINPDRPQIGSEINVELMLSEDGNWMSWNWKLTKGSSINSGIIAQGDGFEESDRIDFDFELPLSQYTSPPYLHLTVEGGDGTIYQETIKIEPVPLRSVNIVMDSEMVMDETYEVEWEVSGQYLNTVDNIERIEFSILTMDYETYKEEVYFVDSDSGEFETNIPSTLNPGSHRVVIEFTFSDGETFEHTQIITVLSSPPGITFLGITIPPLALGFDTILVFLLIAHAIFLHRRNSEKRDEGKDDAFEDLLVTTNLEHQSPSEEDFEFSNSQQGMTAASLYGGAVQGNDYLQTHESDFDGSDEYPIYQEHPINSGRYWVMHAPDEEWALVEDDFD